MWPWTVTLSCRNMHREVQPAGGSAGTSAHRSCCFLCSASSWSRRSIFSCFFPPLRVRDETLRANSLCLSSLSRCVRRQNKAHQDPFCHRKQTSPFSVPELMIKYLLVSVVVRVDVVVKLLVFGVLFVTQLTVEIGSQVFQSLGNGFLLLHLVLLIKNPGRKRVNV